MVKCFSRECRLVVLIGSRTFWLLAMVFLGNFDLTAQPKAFASLQPDRIETGDTTGLILLVSGLSSAPKEVDFNAWSAVMPEANIIGKSAWRRSGTQWTRRYTLIAFDSASLELPSLKILITGGNPLETNGLTLNVFPTRASRDIKDMAKIRDIRREPVSWLDYWPWAGGLISAMILLFWWLRKNQRKPVVVVAANNPAPAPVSPVETALQKLTALQQKALWKQHQIKEHYAELSLILREYLESRYQIAALESTTEEINTMLGKTDFPAASRPELKTLLEKADMVKYAQSHPPESAHLEVLAKARNLIAPNKTQHQAPLKTVQPPHKPHL